MCSIRPWGNEGKGASLLSPHRAIVMLNLCAVPDAPACHLRKILDQNPFMPSDFAAIGRDHGGMQKNRGQCPNAWSEK